MSLTIDYPESMLADRRIESKFSFPDLINVTIGNKIQGGHFKTFYKIREEQ